MGRPGEDGLEEQLVIEDGIASLLIAQERCK